MFFLSGTVRRMSATSWVALEDVGHTSRGIADVELRSDRVRVHHAFTAWKVSSFQATPDDSFTAAGVRVGASVSYGYTDLLFYMGASQVPVDPSLLSRAGANVWLTGWFEQEPEVE
jgi:hypothetical protein